jgi:hypothetical protein
MLVYPVPHAVTQARVQLAADQAEKAAPRIIQEDVLNILAARNEAERQTLAEFRQSQAREPRVKAQAGDGRLDVKA